MNEEHSTLRCSAGYLHFKNNELQQLHGKSYK